MALSDIEKYINKNKSDVDRWLRDLFGQYVHRQVMGEDAKVRSSMIVSDDRRVGKFIEVVRHYSIGKVSYQKAPYNRYGSNDSWYDIYIDHGVFERLAPQYAKEHDFVLIGEEKNRSTDRVEWYPALDGISSAGLIHYFFNGDLYSTYEVFKECKTGNSMNPKTVIKKIIKIFPKRLEGGAEQEMFHKALDRYYDRNVDRAIELLYGYKPKVLSNLPVVGSYERLVEVTLKNMEVRRINTISLKKLCASELKQMLPEALILQQYANALVEDLTALKDVVGETNDDIVKEVMDKAPADLMMKAPLMLTSTSELERTIAGMLLKGSNKGII